MILTPQEYAQKLPGDLMICEAWHSHEREHVDKGWVASSGYADRFVERFGYLNPKVYEPNRKGRRYTVAWLPIPATGKDKEAFASVYNNFNITTTLNLYPMEYFHWWVELAGAQERLRRLRRNKHIIDAKDIKSQESLVDKVKAKRPKSSYVDLAIDIDSGAEQPVVHTLEDALDVAIRIEEFLSLNAVPHQLFFSGSKGFHIVIDHRVFGQTLAENNHLINRTMIELMEEEMGKMHFDRAIYSARRQFRLVNTRHAKSGLFKVYLKAADLHKGLPHVRNLAKTPQPEKIPKIIFNDYLGALYARASHQVNHLKRYDTKPRMVRKIQPARQSLPRKVKKQVDGKLLEQLIITDIARLHLPPCMKEALHFGVIDRAKANRNQVTLLMAMFYKEIGRSHAETRDFLIRHAQVVLSQYSSSSPEQINSSTISAVKAVFESAQYSKYNCHFARKLGFNCNDTCEWFKHMRDTASSRRLYNVPKTGALSKRKIFQTVEELRADMMKTEAAYIDEIFHNAKKVVPLLVKVPPGVGKTTGLFRWLGENPLLRILWVGGFHKLYENIPTSIKSRWLQIRGRHGDISDDKGNPIPANCSQSGLASVLRGKRLNVTELLCQNCADKDHCDYFAQFEDSDFNWFVMQPMFLHKVHEKIDAFDIVVIDEEILSQFIEKIPIKPRDVHNLIVLVEELITDLSSINGRSSIDSFKAMRIFLKGLLRLLMMSRVKGPLIGDVLIRSIDQHCRRIQEVEGSAGVMNLKQLIDVIGKRNFDLVQKLPLYYDNPDRLPMNFTKELLEVLHFEINLKDKDSNLSRLSLEGLADDDGKWKSRLRVYHKLPAPTFKKPAIILDGTGQKMLYEALFECPIDVYDPDLLLLNIIEYVFSASGSVTSLSNKRHRGRMFDVLDAKLKEYPRTLVIAKMQFEAEIRSRLPPEAKFVHYFGIRGSNEFRDMDQVILFGVPALPPEEILLMASALFYRENLNTAQEDLLKRFPGTEKGIKVRSYVEPKIQAIAEAFREVEMIQAAHRIRLIYSNLKKAVIIAGIVLDGFPPTTLQTVQDVLGPTESTKKVQRREFITTMIELQLERLGFVCPALTLKPLLQKGERPPPDLVEFLKSKSAWVEVGEKDKMPRSSFARYLKDILDNYGLETSGIKPLVQFQCKPLLVYGQDDNFIVKAEQFVNSLSKSLNIKEE